MNLDPARNLAPDPRLPVKIEVDLLAVNGGMRPIARHAGIVFGFRAYPPLASRFLNRFGGVL
jgi:hypothetical protein